MKCNSAMRATTSAKVRLALSQPNSQLPNIGREGTGFYRPSCGPAMMPEDKGSGRGTHLSP